MSNAIVPLADTMQLGKVLAGSGFFSDARQEAQAVVKVLAGRELGFGPIASMTGINIIKGKVSIGANLMAAAIRRDSRYDYKLKQHDATVCTIEFYYNGEAVGESSFTVEDAKTAGLSGDNWKKYPKNMLFARAISNGAKWYCPDIFGGPVYTPDELGAQVDGETGDVIEHDPGPEWKEPVISQNEEPDPPAPTNGRQWPDRPWEPETLREAMQVKAAKGTKSSSEKQRKYARASLAHVTLNDEGKRKSLLKYLYDLDSTNDLTSGQASAIIDWVGSTADNDWSPSAHAIDEAERVVKARMVELGQQELL